MMYLLGLRSLFTDNCFLEVCFIPRVIGIITGFMNLGRFSFRFLHKACHTSYQTINMRLIRISTCPNTFSGHSISSFSGSLLQSTVSALHYIPVLAAILYMCFQMWIFATSSNTNICTTIYIHYWIFNFFIIANTTSVTVIDRNNSARIAHGSGGRQQHLSENPGCTRRLDAPPCSPFVTPRRPKLEHSMPSVPPRRLNFCRQLGGLEGGERVVQKGDGTGFRLEH